MAYYVIIGAALAWWITQVSETDATASWLTPLMAILIVVTWPVWIVVITAKTVKELWKKTP